MSQSITWKAYGTGVTISPGATLANAAGYVSAAQGADGTGGDLFADFRISVTIGTAPSANQPIYLYLLRGTDGTNYVDGSTSIQPQDALRVGTFVPRAVNTAQVLDLPLIQLPPGLWKVLLWNACGQTMNSGYTIYYRPYDVLAT